MKKILLFFLIFFVFFGSIFLFSLLHKHPEKSQTPQPYFSKAKLFLTYQNAAGKFSTLGSGHTGNGVKTLSANISYNGSAVGTENIDYHLSMIFRQTSGKNSDEYTVSFVRGFDGIHEGDTIRFEGTPLSLYCKNGLSAEMKEVK